MTDSEKRSSLMWNRINYVRKKSFIVSASNHAKAKCKARVKAGNPNRRERISTIDLLVPTSSDQLLFKLRLYEFFPKQPILIRRSTVLSLFLQEVFPGERKEGLAGKRQKGANYLFR
jgi:hypothetical protein